MKTKFNGILTLLLAFVVQVSFAQEMTVSGVVTDQSGSLPGVNILIKGTTTGTDTDFDGKYSIEATTGDVLVFRYLGYTTSERKVGSASIINVTLVQGGEVLDEIVVTALGIKRDKKSIGFSQQSVKAENLVRSRETDLNNALAGRVAGVQAVGAPGASFGNSGIRLRGDSDVLYIVDNIKISSISDVNTDDIADLSVLKGSAATALYGPEGINGVVIITTKTAKSGESIVSLNHSTSLENAYSMPEYQNEYGGGYSQDFNTFSFEADKHPASWASFDGQSMVEYYADESWGPKMDGQLVRHWDSWIPGDPEFGKLRAFSPNENNIKDIYETGVTNNTSVSFAKGGEDYKIRVGLSNIERASIMPNSKRKTVQASINASLNISDKLTAFANVNYQDRRTQNNPNNGYGNVASNVNQWYQRQLDTDRIKNYKRNGQFVSWNINSPSNAKPLYWDSPYFEFYENVNHQTKNATYGRIGLKYDFNEDLNFNIDLKKTANSYESDDREAFGGLPQPYYEEDERSNYRDELFGIANYSKDLNEDFDIAASVGFELSTIGSQRIYAGSVGGLTTLGFYSLSTSVDRPSLSTLVSKFKTQSIFAKASVGYKDILFLDGFTRLDWASSANPDDNRVETYGGSVSFIFSKLLPTNDILPFGKLRVSAAQAPRFPSPYSLNPAYDINTPYDSNGSLSAPDTFANPLLRGGIRKDYEIGTDLRMFNSRLGIDFAYFKKIDSELPISISLDGSTGYDATRSNDGQQTYSGIELAINTELFRKENFGWNATLSFATLKRTVDKISDGVDVNVLSSSWSLIQLQERVGEEWGAIYGRAFQRDDAGNILLSSTGFPQYDTNQNLGNVLPDFTGGLSNNIRYKNFNFGFDIDFQKGGKVFSVTRMFNNYSGLGAETVGNNNLGNPVRDALVASDGSTRDASTITTDNPTGDAYISLPTNIANSNSGGVLIEGVDQTSGEPVSYNVNASDYWGRLYSLHERWLYDATYVKLRTVRLDYDLTKDMLAKTPFKSLNVGVFANNVWLIHSSIPGLDPSEIETRNGVNWTEGGQLPNVRTVGLNLRMTF